MAKYTLSVNGRSAEVDAAEDTPLLYVLANALGLKGPRLGCGLAQCGSCSVLIDGVESRSCVTPVSEVRGKPVVTFEGLAALYAREKNWRKRRICIRCSRPSSMRTRRNAVIATTA